MTLLLAALAAFFFLFVVDRLIRVPPPARGLIALVVAAFAAVALRDGYDFTVLVLAWAAAGLALALSEVAAMIQAVTDEMRVRVMTVSTRRGRVPPL